MFTPSMPLESPSFQPRPKKSRKTLPFDPAQTLEDMNYRSIEEAHDGCRDGQDEPDDQVVEQEGVLRRRVGREGEAPQVRVAWLIVVSLSPQLSCVVVETSLLLATRAGWRGARRLAWVVESRERRPVEGATGESHGAEQLERRMGGLGSSWRRGKKKNSRDPSHVPVIVARACGTPTTNQPTRINIWTVAQLTMLRPYNKKSRNSARPFSPEMRALTSAAARTMSVKATEGMSDPTSHA